MLKVHDKVVPRPKKLKNKGVKKSSVRVTKTRGLPDRKQRKVSNKVVGKANNVISHSNVTAHVSLGIPNTVEVPFDDRVTHYTIVNRESSVRMGNENILVEQPTELQTIHLDVMDNVNMPRIEAEDPQQPVLNIIEQRAPLCSPMGEISLMCEEQIPAEQQIQNMHVVNNVNEHMHREVVLSQEVVDPSHGYHVLEESNFSRGQVIEEISNEDSLAMRMQTESVHEENRLVDRNSNIGSEVNISCFEDTVDVIETDTSRIWIKDTSWSHPESNLSSIQNLPPDPSEELEASDIEGDEGLQGMQNLPSSGIVGLDMVEIGEGMVGEEGVIQEG